MKAFTFVVSLSFTYCSRLYFLSGAGNLELQVVSVLCVNLEKDCPGNH